MDRYETDKYINELEQQRDDLVEACKEVMATFVGYAEGSIGGQALKKVRDALAKAQPSSTSVTPIK
jgi:hypothetical protein